VEIDHFAHRYAQPTQYLRIIDARAHKDFNGVTMVQPALRWLFSAPLTLFQILGVSATARVGSFGIQTGEIVCHSLSAHPILSSIDKGLAIAILGSYGITVAEIVSDSQSAHPIQQ